MDLSELLFSPWHAYDGSYLQAPIRTILRFAVCKASEQTLETAGSGYESMVL